MKFHNINILLAGAAAVSVASCSQEPLNPTVAVKEEYTKNFITEFGVPAPGHDFAMAKSAGLKVKTATGGHVTVTAEVDGKEYLFADVNLTPGIHDLPVTLPQSVTKVKIRSGFNTIEAGVNDIVDIDEETPVSRNWTYGDITYTMDGMPVVLGLTTDNLEPMIAFEPKKLLDKYFAAHPTGAHNSTDYYYQGYDIGDGSIQPYIEPHEHLYFGETSLGSEGEYMVFPIWWRKNDNGSKNYSLVIHDCNIFNNGPQLAPFNDPTNTSNPFPDLKYYTGNISDLKYSTGEETNEQGIDEFGNVSQYKFIEGESIVYDKLVNNLDKFVSSAGDNAYSIDDTPVVISQGVRIKFDKCDEGWGVGFCLISEENGKERYSFSIPYWNREAWGDAYFDEALDHLFFSYVSTMQFPLTKLGSSENLFFNIWQKMSYSDDKPYRLFTGKTNDNSLGDSRFSKPFLLGFSSQANNKADRVTARDYTDCILLVVPIKKEPHLVYRIGVSPTPYLWTMAVEDLGGTDDWDFNDAVFHFTDVISNLNTVNKNNCMTNNYGITPLDGPADATSARVITVWPEATGGTLPIYITFLGTAASVEMPSGGEQMYSDVNNAIRTSLNNAMSGSIVLGTEVHNWLGSSDYTKFINVGTNRTGNVGKSVQFAIPSSVELSYSNYMTYGSVTGRTLYGFALLVDRENKLGIDTFNDQEKGLHLLDTSQLDDKAYIMIGAPDEKGSVAPQMLLIGDGDGSWQWPTERTKISDAYPGFNAWVTDRNNSGWTKNPDESHVTKK